MADSMKGVFNILATPFDQKNHIDIDSLRGLIEFQIDKGVHGLTILGVLGEAAKLSVEERTLVMQTVIEAVAGRIPVVVGTSHQETPTCIALSQDAFAAGVAGVMIAPPIFDKPSDAAVLEFYEEVADAIDKPIVIQDFPPVTNVIMSPDVLVQIAEHIPNARYLKLEDPPLMQKISAIQEQTDRYVIFGGSGGMFFIEELERGAGGTMTGFAFSEILVAIYHAFADGRHVEARTIFDRYLPLIRFESQPEINLTIRKEILCRRGAIAHAAPRQPFAPIDEATREEIGRMFQRVGIADPTSTVKL